MFLQTIHQVVDCPICGRPLEVQAQLVSHEIACSHCRGEFTVHETNDGLLATITGEGTGLLMQAEELLRATGDVETLAADCRCQRPLSPAFVSDHKRWPYDSRLSPLEEAGCETESLPTVVLIEHRDEVFARIATDMAEFGMRVIRAKSATEALILCGTHELVLVVANVSLPDHSGWLLAAKLRFVDRHTRIWLYQTQSSNYDIGLANFLNVDDLLDCHGDLLSLSETIIELMTDWCEQASDGKDLQDSSAA